MSRPGLVSRPSSATAAKKTIVLVTGGNAGIGYHITSTLSSLPNYQILLGCRDTAKGEAAVASMGAPPNVNPIQLDITDDESIEHAYLAIAQVFGRLDAVVLNAGISGRDLPEPHTPRELFTHILSTNVTSNHLLLNHLAPLLDSSPSPHPKVIILSSNLGSISTILSSPSPPPPYPEYGSSKAALNYLAAYFSKLYPRWSVNAVCPGLRATGLSGAELSEDTDPAKGAVRVVQLVREEGGGSGTFSDEAGVIPW